MTSPEEGANIGYWSVPRFGVDNLVEEMLISLI